MWFTFNNEFRSKMSVIEENTCRLCSGTSENNVNIFSAEESDGLTSIGRMIVDCLLSEVGFFLFSNFCMNSFSTIANSHEFYSWNQILDIRKLCVNCASCNWMFFSNSKRKCSKTMKNFQQFYAKLKHQNQHRLVKRVYRRILPPPMIAAKASGSLGHQLRQRRRRK